MLDKIDLSKKVDKKTYDEKRDELETKLGALQRECKAAGIPVIIVFEGMGAAGKGVQINSLIQALDPRGFDVYACNRPARKNRCAHFCGVSGPRPRPRGGSRFSTAAGTESCRWTALTG